jgi:hypothetical protein
MFEYVVFFLFPISRYSSSLMAKFFFERCKDEAIDELPYIRHKPHRFKLPLFVIITKVVGVNLGVEEKNALGEQVLPKPFGKCWKSSFMDPENYKATMAQAWYLFPNHL